MKTEKKIFIDKNDSLAVVVDKAITSSAGKIILNIPNGSAIGSSMGNFQILKREAVTAGKEITVESVDDHVLELAELVGLKAANPFFKIKKRTMADILPPADFSKKSKDIDSRIDREEIILPKKVSKKTVREQEKEDSAEPVRIEHLRDKKERNYRKPLRFFVICAFLALFLWGGFELATKFLPKVNIDLVLKKIPIEFEKTIRVQSAETSVSLENQKGEIVLPGELLASSGNLSLEFPAKGIDKVEIKAKGKLSVYNAYSSEPQVLVATTRLESPDGKIFRLIEKVTVPGAKVVNGKITPSKIDVAVIADKAGEEFNIAPYGKWQIPGFKDTPRYGAFYAELAEPMTGGFIGEKAVPTAEDIEKAKAVVLQSLKDSLEGKILMLFEDRFKLFESAKSFSLIKEEVGPSNDSSKFSVFAEGEMKYLVFDETMLRAALTDAAKKGRIEDLAVKSFEFSYQNNDPQVDFALGETFFPVKGSVVFESVFDAEKFKNQIVGFNEAVLKESVFALPGLEKANISFWPFWVNETPRRVKRIEISVD